MATTYLTNGLTAVSGTIGTVSLWVKRSTLGTSTLYHFFEDNVTFCRLRFDSSDKLHWETYDNNTSNGKFKTNRLFRDTSAFYHIVVRVDTTQSTEADRFKLYVNGSEETSFSTSNYPTQNRDVKMTAQPYIGTEWQGSGVNYFDGNMTHIHYTDGQSYAASTFGETDTTSGIWKPKTSPTVTYGSKGFFLKFENSGAMGTDSSGNGNNFTTIGGTLTQNVDTPSNVFATMNPLYKAAGIALSNGNLTSVGSASYTTVCSTMAVNSGKWYWEAKCNTASPNSYFNVGVIKTDTRIDTLSYPADSGSSGYILAKDGYIYYNGSQSLNTGTTVSPGDIVGFILDMDAGTLKLKKNGSDVYSGNAVVSSLNTGDFWYVTHGANPSNVNFNFGNGFFGTTAISSEGTNASGIGKFEYDVPANHTAICTKGLNE